MSSPVVSLSWNGHHRTLIRVFERLLENSILVDCTLSAEGRKLKAHKDVLSAFSPYFEKLFKEDHEDSTVILSGITYPELRALIDFIYHGKVTVLEDKVEDLIDVAQSLQIKGLGGSAKEDSGDRNDSLYLQAKRTCPSGIPRKRKRTDDNVETASALFTEDANFVNQSSVNSSQNHIPVDNIQHPPVVSQTSDGYSNELSTSSGLSNTNQSLLKGNSTSLGDSEHHILHPETIVKIELGTDDDDTCLSKDDYPIEPKIEKTDKETSCKYSKNSCEDADSDLYVNDNMSSVNNSHKHMSRDHADTVVCATTGLISVKNVSSNGIPIASSSRNEASSSNTSFSSSMDSTPAETEDPSMHTELILKTEPTEQDDNQSYYGARNDERAELMGRIRGRSMYSGSAAAVSEDGSVLQQWTGGGRTDVSVRGPGVSSLRWASGGSEAKGSRRGGGNPRPPRQYSCPECFKVFNQSCNLKVHMRIHTGEKPYKCTECDFAATHISNLKQHQRTHSGERPYKCTECDYAATDISSFKRHQRMHNGERPYKCPDCDYAATDIGSFKRHQRIHSGERPYKCPDCEYAATGSGDLKKHQRIHSREQPYREVELDNAAAGTSNLIHSIPKYFENFNIFR